MRSVPFRMLACAVAACAAAVLGPVAARAAESATETRLREALRTATGQLNALQDERASWQAKEATLRKEMESMRKELAAAKRAPARAGRVAELDRRLAEQAEVVAKLNESLAQCQGSARGAAEAARATEAERDRLRAEKMSLDGRVAACEAKNLRMYAIGKGIIDWLSNIGFGEALLTREPFLGFKRVELESVAQSYEDKLVEQRVKP